MKRLVWVGMLLTIAYGTSLAQTRKERLMEKKEEVKTMVDSVLSARYFSVKHDTVYIGRPVQPLTLKVRTSVSGNEFRVRRHGAMEGNGTLKSDHKATLNLGASWRGVSAGVSLNPASLKGKNKDFEFNLNTYSNRYGIDGVYQDTRTLSGDVKYGDMDGFLGKDILRMKMVNVNGYYAFSGRRFSYPAAFSQSYIQKRSAGSWLAGFSYMGGSLKTTNHQAMKGLSKYRIYVGHFGVGGGYGYNWVAFRGRLLMHLSALPTVVIGNYNNVRVNDERHKMDMKFPDLILTERGAVVYNFSQKWFAAGSVVMTNSLLGDDEVDINFWKWRGRLSLGMRL